jgi:hypothetical protein
MTRKLQTLTKMTAKLQSVARTTAVAYPVNTQELMETTDIMQTYALVA